MDETQQRNLVDHVDSLTDKSTRLDEQKMDFTANAGDFSWTEFGQLQPPSEPLFGTLSMRSSIPAMDISDHAFGQWRSRMGKMLSDNVGTLAKGDWEALRLYFPEQFAVIANRLNQYYGSDEGREDLLVRANSTKVTQPFVRAILTKRYQIVSNTAMLEAVRAVLVESEGDIQGGTIIRPELDADALRLRVIIKETTTRERGIGGDKTAPYGVGFIVSNDEIGRGSVRIASFIQRNACSNSILIDDENALKMAHVTSPVAILAMVKMKAGEMLELSGEALNRVYAASVAELPSLGSIITNMAKDYGWSEELTGAINRGTEGMNSQLGLINGITFAAHTEVENLDDRYEMEALGGALLMREAVAIERQYGERRR